MLWRNWIFYLFTVIILLSSIPVSAESPPVLFNPPLSPRIANYSIHVSLDENLNRLQGQQKLLWYNKTDRSTDELQFHLYLNGFRNSESTWMKEGRKRHGSKMSNNNIWGFIDVTRLAVRHLNQGESNAYYHSSHEWPELDDADDLTGRISFHHPDDDNLEDKTVIRVKLDHAIQPGKAILIDMDFIARLPSPPVDRTGAKNEYFFAGQWFPKIGVLEEDGWNCHQFHLESEFFADFGTYDVWMDVPADNLLAATGVEVKVSAEKDQRRIHYYHAEDVHDFAWTTSPEFVEFTGQSQDVAIRVLMQPDHRSQGHRHLQAAIDAVRYFQDWYGDYPFSNLSVIDPQRGARASGGMEYPTLITIGTQYGIPADIRMPENTIIHEFAHNYWYHLLASNEFEESWLDEGMATYTQIQVSNALYGPEDDSVDFLGIKINSLQTSRFAYLSMPDYDPTIRDTWKYYSPHSFGTNSYSKPGLFLTTLHNYLGQDLMHKVIQTYVKRFSFKHPTSRDFSAVVSEVTQQDLNWFFDQALYTNKILDYAVSEVESTTLEQPRGFDYTLKTDDIHIDASNEDENASEVSEDDKPMYQNIVSVRRIGDFIFPVEVEVVFENGEIIQEQWDGKALWTRFLYVKDSKLRSVTVDPKHKIPFDINITNNSMLREKDLQAVLMQTGSWFERFQVIADFLTF